MEQNLENHEPLKAALIAKVINVNRKTIVGWVQTGLVDGYMVGKRGDVRITVRALFDYLDLSPQAEREMRQRIVFLMVEAEEKKKKKKNGKN